MMRGKKVKFLIAFLLFTVAVLFLYRYSPRKFEFLGYYDKIGAHRVNSLEKLDAALHYFNAIELDLMYNETEHLLDVNHPPTPSINLRFDTYLANFEVNEVPFLWLDIKNLTETNSQEIHDLLVSIFKSKSYPLDKVLIETRYPEALPIFSTTGFNTTYYLPQRLMLKDSTALADELNTIKEALNAHPKLGISTAYADYHILKSNFPNKTKYIWSIGHSKIKDYKLIQNILKDETVKIVLASYRVFKGNR